MRDMETCQAEVFRRSENRIRERARRRRKIGAACMSLALCLVVGALVLPPYLTRGAGRPTAPQSTEQNSTDSTEPNSLEQESGYYKSGSELVEGEPIAQAGNSAEALNQEEILKIAKTAVTIPYDYVEAAYDEDAGQWSVHFGQKGVAGGDQTVTLDPYGTLLNSTYGE